MIHFIQELPHLTQILSSFSLETIFTAHKHSSYQSMCLFEFANLLHNIKYKRQTETTDIKQEKEPFAIRYSFCRMNKHINAKKKQIEQKA